MLWYYTTFFAAWQEILPLLGKIHHSALPLLMFLVLGADDHYLSVTLDYSAFVAHRLYRRSYFHVFILLVLVTPCDPSLGKIIQAEFYFYGVAFENFDIVLSQLSLQIRRDHVRVGQLDLEFGAV